VLKGSIYESRDAIFYQHQSLPDTLIPGQSYSFNQG
jgi:hypothetical protein